MKKVSKLLFGRLTIGMLLLLLQIYWFVSFLFSLGNYSEQISALLRIISLIAVIYIINKNENPAYKLAWVILILLFPIWGGAMYLYIGNKRPARRLRKKLEFEEEKTKECLVQNQEVSKELEILDPIVAKQMYYLSEHIEYPVYQNSEVMYFPSGEECFEKILSEIEKAEHYIFMEYFIVKDGTMLEEILAILQKKAKQGIDIRFLYDDVGCISELERSFEQRMREYGIKTLRFNRFIPIVSTAWNNRDHRKILVIDGKIGFTGGFNLADEYVNREKRFGYWKDSGIMVCGEAVWSMTVMFLRVWNAYMQQDEDYTRYQAFLSDKEICKNCGFIQPYADSPLNSETVGRNTYFNMINGATRYLYLTTPYLILDNELVTALSMAAKKGVDVRIITPGIPDKKMVYLVTQSYFYQLINAGVRIYSYTPGFIHAKNAISDGKIASVGTVNLDYRSFYLHFECGVLFSHTDTIDQIYDDYRKTLAESREITLEECTNSFVMRIVQSILRVFSPLL